MKFNILNFIIYSGFWFLISINQIYCQKIVFGGHVSFKSEAPLEIVQATNKKLTGIIDITTYDFAFSLPVKAFEGFNSALQKEHFNENYMESNDFPKISYVGRLLDAIDFTKNGIYEVRSKGKFTIHGITQERILKNSVEILNGTLKITSNFKILLEEYNISIPKIVQKKIAEEIHVNMLANSTVK